MLADTNSYIHKGNNNHMSTLGAPGAAAASTSNRAFVERAKWMSHRPNHSNLFSATQDAGLMMSTAPNKQSAF